MFELKLGKMTTAEIAEWAGVKEITISKNKVKWCEKKLSKYAKYELVYGGVIIHEIIEPIYSQKPKEQVKKLTKKCWGIGDFKVDTQVNVARKVAAQITPSDLLSTSTLKRYVGDAKREMYGVAKKREGYDGYCKWVFCKVDQYGQAIPFTSQENEIKKELLDKYIKTDADKLIDIKGASKDLANGDMTIEEYNELVNELIDRDCGWAKFQQEFEKAIDAHCDVQTMIIDFKEPSAFDLLPKSNASFNF